MKTIRWRYLAIALFVALVAAGCGSSDGGDSSATTATPGAGGTTAPGKSDVCAKRDDISGTATIRLVPQDFGESKTLTEVYAQCLKAKGYKVEVQKASGFREIVYPALEANKADLILDYTGSAASFLDDSGTPSADSDETFKRLEGAIGDKPIKALKFSPAEDKNALVVLKKFADTNKLTKTSDLKAVEDQVTFGGSAQCSERTDCLLGYQDPKIYDLKFKATKVVEYGPPLAAGLKSDALQAAQYQTTAAEIESGDFVVLKDDKGMLSADNVVPVVRTAVLDEYGDSLTDDINAISAVLTTEDLIGWNAATDIKKLEPVDVAQTWLSDKGFI